MSSPPSTSSAPDPPPQTVTSDPRHGTMETYWREVRSIEEEKEGQEEEEEEERKSIDEVELEEAWLMEAGLSSLVMGLSSEEASPPAAEALLSTLTRQQAATVRKRLDNYNETLKTRNRQPIRDVRDIFTEPDDDSADRCTSPPSHCAESPLSRYHTSTKTIRRNTHRVRPTLPTFLFEDQLPEHLSSPTKTHFPTNTHSPTNAHSPTNTHSLINTPTYTPSPPHLQSVSQSRRADWLLRDSPYSEGVAEHKQSGTCCDCLCFEGVHGDDLPFVPVSPSQGLTWADDLSSYDLIRLGFISHIELSTFLLTLGVQIKRTRPLRHKTRGSWWAGAYPS